MEMTGGQALAQSLKIEGVDTVFGLPGIQMDFLFDAIWEERDHFAVHHTRHEQATAYMADGYARTTGRIGTFVVVPGPGLLNATAGLSTAYACSSPVLCVTGQVDSAQIDRGRGALHEIPDQLGLIRHLTKHAERATRPEEIPGMVRRAAKELQTGRPRPVEIEVPPDILGTVADVTLLEPEAWDRSELHQADSDLLEQAAKFLGEAERPLICAGGGALSSGAWEELSELARLLEAPVLMTSNGRGVLSDRDYRAHSGRVAIQELVPNADAILVIGTRFLLAVGTGNAQACPVNGRVIRAEIDPEEVDRNYPSDVALIGDARHTARELLDRVPKHNRSRESRERELSALKEAQHKSFEALPLQRGYANAIREALPDDGILVSESTQVGYLAQMGGFPVYEPRTFVTSGYQGTLGYGFATALGVQVGNPDRKVVSINGDGGFMYNVQELSTQAQQKIPLVTVVFNDNAYGNVRRIQQQRYGGRLIASDLKNPSFARLAELFDVAGYRANNPDELRRTLKRALDSNQPALIEVPMPPTTDLPSPFPMPALPPRPKLNL
jgi:acetolactate synthase I/II/III large subunit